MRVRFSQACDYACGRAAFIQATDPRSTADLPLSGAPYWIEPGARLGQTRRHNGALSGRSLYAGISRWCPGSRHSDYLTLGVSNEHERAD
jgi:hypothetical protein